MSRSKPTYEPLMLDEKGRFHLFIGIDEGVEALIAMINSRLEILKPDNTWFMLAGDQAKEQERLDDFLDKKSLDEKIQFFSEKEQLLDSLPNVLETMSMGLRLYCAGDEQFLWELQLCTSQYGMGRSEIWFQAIGSKYRRVYCPHCGNTTKDVKTNITQCASCHLYLEVTDHFSRNLAAYLAIRADAETPGELPQQVEAYE